MTLHSKVSWKAAAAGVCWRIEPFIDGRYSASSTDEQMDNINPATEMTLCCTSVGDARDVDAAVRVARQRFNEGCWSDLPALRRGEILGALADLLLQHKAEIALLDTLEMGKPIAAALFDVEHLATTVLRLSAGYGDKLFGDSIPLSSRMMGFNVYEPRGVVGAIIPWNFPIANAAIKIAPALAAGNSIVIKPSELTASSALKLAELALEAGVPEGVLNVVPGLGSTVGAALALHPDVDLLSFTGSTATGRKLLELSGRSNGKPVMLECGGKSPQIVFSDIEDLDAVAEAAVQSALWNQGQVCVARTRVLAHADIKSTLLEKIVSRAGRWIPADPLDESTTFGSLASSTQRRRVRGYIEHGLHDGAEPVLQGAIQDHGGCFVAPTVFDGVKSTMSIVHEEIFGPVLCVQPFKSEAEALALANETQYGLAATVWTRDMGCARRLARGIRAGDISICSGGSEAQDALWLLGREPQKASGFGSEFGRKGLESYSTLKAVTFSGV